MVKVEKDKPENNILWFIFVEQLGLLPGLAF
jgi:hypothetical protein